MSDTTTIPLPNGGTLEFVPSTCRDAWTRYGKPAIDSDYSLIPDAPRGTHPYIGDCFDYYSSFRYVPSFGGNVFFATWFGIFLIAQLVLGWRYRTWGFMVGMVFGSILELVGYASRAVMAQNPFDGDAFLAYLICLTIAPVFIAAAIYLAATRIIIAYGAHLSRFPTRVIAPTLMITDFITLVLQAIGGAITDTAEDITTRDAGKNIMIAGLVMQVVSLLLFLAFVADFALRCLRRSAEWSREFASLQKSKIFLAFVAGTVLASVLILIRSVFRVAELSNGFDGPLWNSEVDFMVLDGAMCALTVTILTFLHPGIGFQGADSYRAADWRLRKRGSGRGHGDGSGAEKGPSVAETGIGTSDRSVM